MTRSKRAPYVAVRTDVVKDEAFAMLADLAGCNWDEAFGRWFRLCAFCRDRGLRDAPDGCRGYAVHDAVVRRFLGPRGVEAILGDDCDALALGERFGDGLIYLRGTSETVAALRAHAATSAAGGVARACGNRDTLGRFSTEESVAETTLIQPEATQTLPCTPPESSVPPSSFLQDQREGEQASPDPAPRKPRGSRKKPVTALPENWQPRPHERDKAVSLGLDCDREAQRFRDYHVSKGNVFADWDAAFRTWLSNGARFQSNTAQPALRVAARPDDDYSRIPGMEAPS